MTNKERYALLCKEEPSICIYDQPWWMDAVCGEDNWDVLLYEKGEQILAAMPYYIKSRYGLKYITQPDFTQHNGAWIKYPQGQSDMKRISMEKEILTYFIEQLEHLPVCYYQQQFSPNLTNWLPFYWKGYSQETYYTYRFPDIHNPEELFSIFGRDKKRNIRKAMELGLQFHLDLPADQFYVHHKESLLKHGKEISYSYERFEKIYNAVYTHSQGKTLYLTDSNGVLVCAALVIWDTEWGYDLIGTSAPKAYGTSVKDLLEYKTIQFLSDKVKGYDFEGSMIENIEESYRHFGATQTSYFKIQKTFTRNPLLRAAIKQKLQ